MSLDNQVVLTPQGYQKIEKELEKLRQQLIRLRQKIRDLKLHVADLNPFGDAVLRHIVRVKLSQRRGRHLHACQIVGRGEKDDLGGKLFVFLAIQRLRFARRHQTPAQSAQRKQMFNARFVPDKLLEFVLRDASLRQHLL